MRKTDACKENTFEKCLNVCKHKVKKIEDCVQLCAEGVKRVCGRKTKVKIANVSAETEDNNKGWILIIFFIIIIILIFVATFLSK